MAVLKAAQTDAVLAQDPSISLKNLIGGDVTTNPAGQYNISSPAAADVRFDTKFARWDKHNVVIVENMPNSIVAQTIGALRWRVKETKRVQIWCDTKSAKNNKWLIEQELLRIINTNVTGLRTVGIDEIHAHNLTEIAIPNNDNEEVGREGYLARSYFLVDMIYDLYKV